MKKILRFLITPFIQWNHKWNARESQIRMNNMEINIYRLSQKLELLIKYYDTDQLVYADIFNREIEEVHLPLTIDKTQEELKKLGYEYQGKVLSYSILRKNVQPPPSQTEIWVKKND